MKIVYYGLNSLTYLGPKIWALLPNNLRRLESVEAFKSKIKSYKAFILAGGLGTGLSFYGV